MAEVAVVIRVDTQGAEGAEQLIRGLTGSAGAAERATQAGAVLERQRQQLAQAAIRLAVAERDYGRALSLVDSQLAQSRGNATEQLNLLRQRATIERQVAAESAAAARAADVAARQQAAGIAAQARAAQQAATVRTRAAQQAAAAETRAAQQAATAEAQAKREREQSAQSAIRAAVAHQDYGRALSLVQAQLNALRPGTAAHNNTLAEQARITREAEAATRGGGSALDDLVGSLGGAAVAFSAFRVAAEGFRLDAQVDASNRSLRVFLGNSQEANEILQAGARFGDKYAFTQTEVAEALRTSAQLFDKTSVGADKMLEILARLGEVNPQEGIQGAAYAVRELVSGDITSLVERFNISRDAARALKEEIQSGADVGVVLDRALNDLGATNELLRQRTEGSQGALNKLKVESQEAKVALGDLIETFGGTALLNAFATGLNDIAGGMRLVSNQAKVTAIDLAILARQGAPELIAGLLGIRTETEALTPAADGAGFSIGSLAQTTGIATEKSQEHAAVQRDLASALLDQAGTSATADVEAAKLALTQQRLTDIARQVESGTLGLASAQGIIRAEFGANATKVLELLPVYQALIRLQNQLNLPGAVGKAVSGAVGDATRAAKEQAAYQRQIADAKYDLLGNEQKLAALQQRLAGGNLTELERLKIQKDIQQVQQQIAADQQRNAKAGTTAANKAERQAEQAAREAERAAAELEKARDDLRSTEEKLAVRKARLATATDETERLKLIKEIRDLEQDITEERERQLKAALDARELALDDAEADAEALKRREQAQAILRNEATSEAQKAAARRTLERLRIEDAQRALELAEKQREAGNQVALPGGPAVPGTVAPGAAIPLGPVVPVGVPSVAIPGMVTPTAQALRLQFNITANLIVDGAVAARAIFPSFEENIVSAMNGAFDRTIATGALETGGP